MASLCCPIETEPRTLSLGQLNHAREAAACVVQTTEPGEASTIFVEGLKPVFSIKEMNAQQETGLNNNRDDTTVGNVVHIPEDTTKQILEKPCQCSCTNNVLIDSPDYPLEVLISEPVSAPF